MPKTIKLVLYRHLTRYSAPSTLGLGWALGSLCLIFLSWQLISGLILAMRYIPEASSAFESVDFILREISFGWIFGYGHALGASFFFGSLYGHIGRGLYYQLYQRPKNSVWGVGVTMYVLVMMTAFLGYSLPWGQMSFWGVTVITSLLTAVPIIGSQAAIWLWGGFTVNDATLGGFFALHFFLPFVVIILALYHIYDLHLVGSTNPVGNAVPLFLNRSTLVLYYVIKDLGVASTLFLCFNVCTHWWPDCLSHFLNNEVANANVTPSQIVPEWYFLPFYAMLRSVPNKGVGALLMGAALIILYFVPFLGGLRFGSRLTEIFSSQSVHGDWFGFFVGEVVILGVMGSALPVWPVLLTAQTASCIYFGYFLFFY